MNNEDGYKTWKGYRIGKKVVLIKDIIVYILPVFLILSCVSNGSEPFGIVLASLLVLLMAIGADFLISCVIFNIFTPKRVYFRYYASAESSMFKKAVLLFLLLSFVTFIGGIIYYYGTYVDVKSVTEGPENYPDKICDTAEQAALYISTNEQIEKMYHKSVEFNDNKKDSFTAKITLVPKEGNSIDKSDFSQYSDVVFTQDSVTVTVEGRYFEHEGKKYAYYYFNPYCKNTKIIFKEGKYCVIYDMSPGVKAASLFIMGLGSFSDEALFDVTIIIVVGTVLDVIVIVLCRIAVWRKYKERMQEYYKEQVCRELLDDI